MPPAATSLSFDPLFGVENLVWAPLRVSEQHGLEALTAVVGKLRELDKIGASPEDFAAALRKLGEIAARRGK